MPLSRCWAARTLSSGGGDQRRGSRLPRRPAHHRRRLGPVAALIVLLAPWSGPGFAAAPDTQAACPQLDRAAHPAPPDEFDSRCRLLDELERRGLPRHGPATANILTELGRRYSTVVELAGEAPLPTPVLDYLLQELPDTARLVNHFGDSDYEVIFTHPDRSSFFATNNRSMQADFSYIDRRDTASGSNHLLFESGKSKLLLWKFAGSALLELGLEQAEGATKYNMNIHIFSDSRGFHLFFKSALFKGLMQSMFKRILNNIVSAVRQFEVSHEVFPTENPDFARILAERLQ